MNLTINCPDRLTWIYYLLNGNYFACLEKRQISLSFIRAVEGFAEPMFLSLHGSKGAPVGCIHPVDASYWRLIETKRIVDTPVQTSSGWEVQWRPVDCAEDVYAYARTRWYPFSLNGMRLIAELFFSLAPDLAFPILSVQNNFGLIDIIYDAQEEFDPDWIPPTLQEWGLRARNLLGDRAIVTDVGYKLNFMDVQIATACGVIYEISPFECEWVMRDRLSSRMLWRGFGVREDYGDLCLCHNASDTKWLLANLKQFCEQRQIRLLECFDWHEEMESDEQGNEIFPPVGCRIIVK